MWLPRIHFQRCKPSRSRVELGICTLTACSHVLYWLVLEDGDPLRVPGDSPLLLTQASAIKRLPEHPGTFLPLYPSRSGQPWYSQPWCGWVTGLPVMVWTRSAEAPPGDSSEAFPALPFIWVLFLSMLMTSARVMSRPQILNLNKTVLKPKQDFLRFEAQRFLLLLLH